VVILSESVEKHDRYVYEMGAQRLSNEQRAKIFSDVLGRSITYDFLSLSFDEIHVAETPQLSVLLGRPLYKLEDWLRENIRAFEEERKA
jgi:hypothetical protein